MKVGIALSPYNTVQKHSGLGVFILNLTLALIKLKPDWDFLLCVRGIQDMKRFASFDNVQFQCLPDNFLWKDLACRRNADVDVWLYLNPSLPLFFKPRHSILIALDLSIFYPDVQSTYFESIKNTLTKLVQKLSFKSVTHTVCISHATKTDVHAFFPHVERQKVTVAMCGFNRVCDIYEPAAVENLPDSYYLMVGVIKPRKNQITAIEAFIAAKEKGLQGKLLIVGKGSGAYYDLVKETVRTSLYADDILFKGYVTNEELVTLYKRARAFVFPSHIEGFGMVLVEAMSCGVPVISSSNSAQGEVANGYALTVDSHDTNGFTEAMLQLESENLRTELIRKGHQRAADFSWEKSAMEYVAVIENVVANN